MFSKYMYMICSRILVRSFISTGATRLLHSLLYYGSIVIKVVRSIELLEVGERIEVFKSGAPPLKYELRISK